MKSRDELERQLKFSKLENEAMQGELQETQQLVKQKTEEMERIYKKLSETRLSEPSSSGQASLKHSANFLSKEVSEEKVAMRAMELQVTKALEALERKSSEVIELKSSLQAASMELDRLKRGAQAADSFKQLQESSSNNY